MKGFFRGNGGQKEIKDNDNAIPQSNGDSSKVFGLDKIRVGHECLAECLGIPVGIVANLCAFSRLDMASSEVKNELVYTLNKFSAREDTREGIMKAAVKFVQDNFRVLRTSQGVWIVLMDEDVMKNLYSYGERKIISQLYVGQKDNNEYTVDMIDGVEKETRSKSGIKLDREAKTVRHAEFKPDENGDQRCTKILTFNLLDSEKFETASVIGKPLKGLAKDLLGYQSTTGIKCGNFEQIELRDNSVLYKVSDPYERKVKYYCRSYPYERGNENKYGIDTFGLDFGDVGYCREMLIAESEMNSGENCSEKV